ncbi:hypothetical protein DEEACLCL_00017 [Salmonella phage CRW-SP2]|nr:hypothetical protein DEEACLCL_00017 [Salmonella phage CRW-SP2]
MLQSQSITMSSNAFEFIRQCRYERKLPNIHRILQEAQRSGVEGLYEHVLFIVGLGSEGLPVLMRQRELVRAMMRNALGKILYTQEKFAGDLIALSKEFGVAVAFVGLQHSMLSKNKWVVAVYGPELWGKRFEFDTEERAELFATYTNSYGDFSLYL